LPFVESVKRKKNTKRRETKPNVEQTRTTPQLNPLNYRYKKALYYV